MKDKQNMKQRRNLLPISFLIAVLSLFIFHAETTSAIYIVDNFNYFGDNMDRVWWTSTSCPSSDSFGFMTDEYTGISDYVGYCSNPLSDSDSTYDFCITKNNSMQTSCSAVMPVYPVSDGSSSSTWGVEGDAGQYQDALCGQSGNVYANNTKGQHIWGFKRYRFTSGSCSLSTTSESIANRYYIIDSLITKCPSYGASTYYMDGVWGNPSSETINLDSVSCATADYGCDPSHDDYQFYSYPYDWETPCRKKINVTCSVTEDCLNNSVCSGSRGRFNGVCDGVNIDITNKTWSNTCGGLGFLNSSVLIKDNGNCVTDGGFVTGFSCDPNYDAVDETSISNVYNHVCKGGIGNACSVDSDCFTGLSCGGGFCNYEVYAIFDDNNTENKIVKTGTINFDPGLSIASDGNIQYACWQYNGINSKCYGNSSQCSSECNGSTYSGANWATTYSKIFGNGGTFPINLIIGSKSNYNDSYSENYCVSGDGTACWSCFDGLKNDDETDVDWGGHCGTPYFLFCNNKQLNTIQTGEISVDYGGVCGMCDNTSIYDDVDLQLLISAKQIVYPFNNSQCQTSQDIQGGIVFFVIFVSVLLFAPVLVLLLILFVVSLVTSITFADLVAKVAVKVYEAVKDKKLK